MSDDQPAPGTSRSNPRVIIGAVIIAVVAITIVALAVVRQTTSAGGLLPILASPTPAEAANGEPAAMVTFSAINGDPLAYLNKSIQVSGEYLPLEKPSCARYSGPDLSWALVSEGLQLEVKGYERIVRILEPGTQMTVQGIWQLYQGPLGCGKGPAVGSTWYLQAQKIIQPNPLVSSGSGSPLNIENIESSLPDLLPTATFTATPTETPTPMPVTPTFTPTTEQIVPTITMEATGSPEIAPTVPLSPTPSTGTPDQSTSTPGPSPTPSLTPTNDPGDGETQPTSTPETPAFPTATELPGGYPAPTDTPDPYA